MAGLLPSLPKGTLEMPGGIEEGVHSSPPEPMRVAQRALIQSAVVCRGSIDLDANDPGVGETHDRLRAWLGHLDLTAAMEPAEAEILGAPLGAFNRQQVIRATWAAEGLAVLAWALRRFDLSEHDTRVDPFTLTASLDFLEEDAKSLVNEGELLRSCILVGRCSMPSTVAMVRFDAIGLAWTS